MLDRVIVNLLVIQAILMQIDKWPEHVRTAYLAFNSFILAHCEFDLNRMCQMTQ